MDSEINPFDFETVKNQRLIAKNKVVDWIVKYKSEQEGKEPTAEELKLISEEIESFNKQEKKYAVLKAKMIRQGKLPRDFKKDARKQTDISSEIALGESLIDEPSVKKLKDNLRIKDT